MLLGFEVAPSDQRLNTDRTPPDVNVPGKFTAQTDPLVIDTVAGVVYVPGEHPAPVIVIWTATVLVKVVRTLKFAVIVAGPSIVSASGFMLEVNEPDQPA